MECILHSIYLLQTPQQGAQTIIHLAVADETAAITNAFFEDCQVSDNATNLVLDDGLAKKLWEASEAYVRLQPEEVHY
ncbi:Retinol dehydrogenase 14 [Portunus trituberculatus]|uniref:Retinol dehydrogenase 14 n=1 Tax=Portunus trituberculatus TaxID=210409 RepID=A0A5B7K2F3_PORTR|nr:Retinol dehydrogenase 14 [Portunus trituberculatus]